MIIGAQAKVVSEGINAPAQPEIVKLKTAQFHMFELMQGRGKRGALMHRPAFQPVARKRSFGRLRAAGHIGIAIKWKNEQQNYQIS